MVDIYHAPKDSALQGDSKGFLHYSKVWRALSEYTSISPEPSLIVAMEKKESQKRLPQLLKLDGIEFEADVKVTFGEADTEVIKNSLEGNLRKHYARKMNVEVKDIIEVPFEIDLDKDNTVMLNPKGISIKKLLSADIIRGNCSFDTYVLAIKNFSDPTEWGGYGGRLERDHYFVAAVADLERPWSEHRVSAEHASPVVEKIIEILTGEKQEAH